MTPLRTSAVDVEAFLRGSHPARAGAAFAGIGLAFVAVTSLSLLQFGTGP